MKEKYSKRLEEILECLDISVSWSEIRDGTDFESAVIVPFKEKYKKFPFTWDSGASKGVIIFPTLGFVIKMPFHVTDDEYYYNDDYEETDYINYCALEEEFYHQAKKLGIEEVFAQTEYITTLDSEYPLYIQEYIEEKEIDKDNCIHNDKDKDIVDSLNAEKYFDYDIDTEWEAELFAQKGYDFYNKFKQFVSDHNINDLRWYDNVGYKNGCPICFDFSGFHD